MCWYPWKLHHDHTTATLPVPIPSAMQEALKLCTLLRAFQRYWDVSCALPRHHTDLRSYWGGCNQLNLAAKKSAHSTLCASDECMMHLQDIWHKDYMFFLNHQLLANKIPWRSPHSKSFWCALQIARWPHWRTHPTAEWHPHSQQPASSSWRKNSSTSCWFCC